MRAQIRTRYLTQEERHARIERLLFKAGVAFRHLWKTAPEEEIDVPPDLKPKDLRRIAARMRAGVNSGPDFGATPDEIEQVARFAGRGIWFNKKMRQFAELLQPLYAEDEAWERAQEQAAFHATKDVVTTNPGTSMDESFRTMKRAFRKRVGRR